MRKSRVLGIVGIVLFIAVVGTINAYFDEDDVEAVIVNEKYTDKDIEYKVYCFDPTNNIQAQHTKVTYYLKDNKIIINNSNIEIMNFTGSSMQPALFAGNKLIVQKYDGEELKEGMIVAYQGEQDYYITHRIRAIYPDHITTQGDNLYEKDESIEKEQIKYIILGVLYE